MQLATLTEVTKQHGVLIQRMCEIFTQQPNTASRVPEHQVPLPTTPVFAPAIAVTPPVIAPTTPVAPSGEALQMLEAEQERMIERLNHFRRFDSPHFDSSCTEPRVVEAWVSAMEKLFEDLFIPEQE